MAKRKDQHAAAPPDNPEPDAEAAPASDQNDAAGSGGIGSGTDADVAGTEVEASNHGQEDREGTATGGSAAAEGNGDPVPEAENTAEDAPALPDEQQDRAGPDPNMVIAHAAASMAYGGVDVQADALPILDNRWLGEDDLRAQRADLAADFLRSWPESTPETVRVHLLRRGQHLPELDHQVRAAWQVFSRVLTALDERDRTIAAEAASTRQAEEKRRMLVARDRLAMTPAEDSPLSEMGKAALRKHPPKPSDGASRAGSQ